MSSAAQEINSALDHPDPRQAVERVKDVVQRRLLLVHPQAKVVRTEFFNHTYVPDLLMTWSVGSRRAERRVYLRESSDPALLSTDVRLLEHEDRPLFVPLADVEVTHEREVLDEVARERRALVIDPSGLGALPARATPRSSHDLGGDALVEGGVGAMSSAHVDRFLSALASGVDGARDGLVSPTRAALQEVSRYTGGEVSGRLTTFLAAMWQGSGRTLSDFPGRVPLKSQLDEAALGLLLTSHEIDDGQFWQRVRTLVDVRTLLATRVSDSVNLQHLMRSVVRSWKGHVCMITASEDHSAEPSWRWRILEGKLALCGPGFQAYIAASRRDLEFPEEFAVPLLAEVRERASRFAIPLTSIRMLLTNRSIGYDSPNEDVTHDPQLDGISAALGREEGVVEAQAVSPSGIPLRCNFPHRTASPPGARSLLPYADLLSVSFRLFLNLSEDDASELDRAISTSDSGGPFWQQAGLFE